MSNYPELKEGLNTFRNCFIKKLLPPSIINGNAVFLKSMRMKDEWTMSEALRVYNIIKPFAGHIEKLGFYIHTIPAIKAPVVQKKPSYTKAIQKLIGYDKELFVVHCGYDTSIINQLRNIEGAFWNNNKKYWNVPLSQTTSLKEFGKKNGFTLTEKGRAMLNNIDDNYEASYKAEAVELNLPMKLQLYPFQSAGVDYCMKNRQVVLGDEMGLGKTPQGIGVALGLDAFPALIICPKSLRLNWQDEIHKFTHKKAIIINKQNIKSIKSFYEMGLAQYFITNFEGARTIFTKEIHEIEIKKGKRAGKTNKKVITWGYENIFKTVILDEAHECRNKKTLRFKTIKPVMAAAEIRLALTGSPIVKGTADLAALFELIGRIDDFGGSYKFVRDYNKMTKSSFRNDKPLPANLKELNIKMRSLCFIRREKTQVLKELPDKMRQVIKVDIDNRTEYDEAVNAFRFWMINQKYDLERIDRAMKAEILVKIGVLKQLSAKGKLTAVKEFVQDIIDSGEKVVVFCWFLSTARFIRDNFDDVLLLTGDQSEDEIKQNKKLFQENKKYKIIVGTYKKAGVGHTLTAASKWISVEEGWTYAQKAQAEDRLHRIGQENAVNCYSFQGVDTVDEGIYEVIMQRGEMEKEATGGSTEIKQTISNYIAKSIYEKGN